ncbi:hypothetical protein YC2023_085689 [Brassica napus]
MALTPTPLTLTSLVNISDHLSSPSPSLHFLLSQGSLLEINISPICFEALKVLSRSKCLARSPTTVRFLKR